MTSKEMFIVYCFNYDSETPFGRKFSTLRVVLSIFNLKWTQ